MVSHDRDFAEQYGDRIIELIDGINKERVAEVIDFVFDQSKMTVAVLGRVRESGEELLDIMDF